MTRAYRASWVATRQQRGSQGKAQTDVEQCPYVA
jgi:hypothetical protein